MADIILGFSGGVDSSVSAELLKRQGYTVHGVYLDIAGDAERDFAVRSAAKMGISLDVADISQDMEKYVCTPFRAAYLNGETPNPCILCNPAVKFRVLLEYADRFGCDFVATGHYARSENGAVYRGRPSNDQSYMLCRLLPSQVKRIVFPLGEYEKTQVRALAGELELSSAGKPDSMEICFIPDKDYISWLSASCALPGPGDFVFHGEKLGTHEGIFRYTVGQRRPGLFNGRKLYVSAINAAENTVELALWEELFKTVLSARDFNWLIDVPGSPFRANVKVRHTKWENPMCTVYPDGDSVKIVCDEAVRAPAAGQSAVLYDGDRLLGGGFISAGPDIL